MQKKGFTLIEIMIVVGIVAILLVGTLLSVYVQKSKAEDSTAKSDLNRLKIAFEDYYNDHNCYPPAEWFTDAANSGGPIFEPYLNKLPFNKKTGLPYTLEKDPTGCKWFKIYATLNNEDDPQAVALRTNDTILGSALGNYGVSSSNTMVWIYTTKPIPSPTPSPSPTPNPNNHYYCSAVNNCSSFDNTRFNCAPSYPSSGCDGGANKCSSVGTCTPL